MDSPTDKFFRLLRDVGIEVDEGPEGYRFISTFDKLIGTEKEHDFARVVCQVTNSREWIDGGFPRFYETQVWKRVRYLTLAKHGNRCQCCGAGPATKAVLHVDHIKPRSINPELALSLDNLQVLCADCNIGKSNKDDTDWRQTR